MLSTDILVVRRLRKDIHVLTTDFGEFPIKVCGSNRN